MQNAIYPNIHISNAYPKAAPRVTDSPLAGARRWLPRRWDLIAVLTLMGSSAVFGASALMHLGL